MDPRFILRYFDPLDQKYLPTIALSIGLTRASDAFIKRLKIRNYLITWYKTINNTMDTNPFSCHGYKYHKNEN